MDASFIIPALLELAGKIYEVIDQWHQRRGHKQSAHREELSRLFNNIASTIDKARNLLEQNQYPSGYCAEMAEYAQWLPSMLDGVIPEDQAQHYAQSLLMAHELEQLYAHLGQVNATQRRFQLDQMFQTAGIFRAAANLISVGH